MNLHIKVAINSVLALCSVGALYGSYKFAQYEVFFDQAEAQRLSDNRQFILEQKCTAPKKEYEQALGQYTSQNNLLFSEAFEALEFDRYKDPLYSKQRELRAMHESAKESCKEAEAEVEQIKRISYKEHLKKKIKEYIND